jgi:uncharacterized protein (AIM24 family)
MTPGLILGGEGFILQKLTGDGLVPCTRQARPHNRLAAGEGLNVDTRVPLAFQPLVDATSRLRS